MTNKPVDGRSSLGDGLTVSAIGFGGMALTPVYGEVDDTESLATLHSCLDLGVTFIDTANVYGGGEQRAADLPTAGRSPRRGHAGDEVRHRQQPDQPVAEDLEARGDAAYVRQSIDESLARLDTDVVDLYYMHRRDLSVPIEETVGAMAELVDRGQGAPPGAVGGDRRRVARRGRPCIRSRPCRASGRSGAVTSSTTSCRQPPSSAWASCRTRRWDGAFSPARSARLPTCPRRATFGATMPRFAGDALDANLAVVQVVTSVAEEADATPAQVALAWLRQRAEAFGVASVPIPGTRRAARVDENAGVVVGEAVRRSARRAGDRRKGGVRESVPGPELGVGRARVTVSRASFARSRGDGRRTRRTENTSRSLRAITTVTISRTSSVVHHNHVATGSAGCAVIQSR